MFMQRALRTAGRRFLASAAPSSAQPQPSDKLYLYTFLATGAVATAWCANDGNIMGGKLITVNDVPPPAPKVQKAKSSSAGFKNLAVSTLPDGRFQVEYDDEAGDNRITQIYTKSGAADGDAVVTPKPKPAPPVDYAGLAWSLQHDLDEAKAQVARLASNAYGKAQNFPVFGEKNTSLLKNHLTPEIYSALSTVKTSFGFTLDQLIQSGVDHEDSRLGIYAGDEECYTVFSPLLDPVIESLFQHSPSATHTSDLDSSKLTINFSGPVESVKLCTDRNIHGFSFPAGASRSERREVEKIATGVFTHLTGTLHGHYLPLAGSSEEDRKALHNAGFLLTKCDRFAKSAGIHRDFPDARGVFANDGKNIYIWVNDVDHLRIFAEEKSGNVQRAFSNLAAAATAVETEVGKAGYSLAKSEHLGYINSCPAFLGTALEAQVKVKLPNLSQQPDFQTQVAAVGLMADEVKACCSKKGSGDKVFTLSNRHKRLGVTEVAAVETFVSSVNKLLEQEQALAAAVQTAADAAGTAVATAPAPTA